MDGRQFDTWTKALAAGQSRRAILRRLGGGLAGALAVTFGQRAAEAGHEGKGHGKPEHPPGRCGPVGQPCKFNVHCCAGLVCLDGACACEPGLEFCDGSCTDPANFQNDPNNCGGCLISCDDGDPCTIDTCVAGECVTTPIVCDDGNPCTDDACVAGECVFTPVEGRACDDGDPCTTEDVCRNGECVGDPVVCPNGGICCDGDCVDPSTDPTNCGDCGVTCAADAGCFGGTCEEPCGFEGTPCCPPDDACFGCSFCAGDFCLLDPFCF